ncbi:MAG: hypothetical protein ACJA1A_001001 [Saprospiraceae bacterium]|jgi:hypothetical protein
MIRSIILFVGVVLIMSCNSDQKKKSAVAAIPEVSTKTESKFLLPSLPQVEMERLFREATFIDYIFYDLPFSISQDNQPSIHANLKLISSGVLDNLPTTCKPIGREFFQINGDIVHEADLYFSDGCYGYVFLKDEKPIYANKLTEEGMKFYTNIINQSDQIKNKAINGK